MTREEAINKVRQMSLPKETMEILEALAPELAESEDERMIREIKRYIKEQGDKPNGLPNGTVAVADMIAWLEKQKYNRMQPVYDNQESFESALDKAWKSYNECGSRTVDSFEDDYIECAHAKGFREGYLFGLEKQKEQKHPNGCFTCDEYKKGYEEGRRNGFTAGYNKAMKEVEQKEQKPEVKLVFPKFRVGDIIRNVRDKWDKKTRRISYVGEHGYNFDYRHVGDKVSGGSFGFCFEDDYELVEQKPAEWDKEDKEMFEAVDESLYCYESGKAPEMVAQIEAERCWLHSLPERFSLQPKQELSEEETKDLVHILKVLDDCYVYGQHDLSKTDYDNLTSTIKSLKPSWKPSEHQMNILKAVKEYVGKGSGYWGEGLGSLIDDLEKLI